MIRLGLLVVCVTLCAMADIDAQSPAERTVAQTLRVQQAMNRARTLLGQNQSADAIALLESELPYIDGNSSYLALLRTAYIAQLRELQANMGDMSRIDQLQEMIQRLDDPTTTPPGERTPPPLPTPPEPEPAPQPKPQRIADKSDPFQQQPLEKGPVFVQNRAVVDQAVEAFEQKRYEQAARLFAQATHQQIKLNDSEKRAWAYCRLDAVVKQLNAPGTPAFDALEAEVRSAMSMVELTPEMTAFAENQVLGEIKKRRGSSAPATTAEAVPAGWNSIETTNFRVLFREQREAAGEAGRIAELSRTATFEKWSGPGSKWAPRCDVYLHDTGTAFAQATGKPQSLTGMAKVSQRGKQILARRLDLRFDDPDCLTHTLPHQLAYVVIAELVGDQPLPRWAGEAMAVLSEPPTQVARYLRGVSRCREQGQFIRLSQLMKMNDFPNAETVTPFYVESVSLVDYLVQLKGTKAFMLFLLEGPRYGYEKALQRQYGIASFNELEQRWLQHASVVVATP